ncbi:MAG: hypothetical protein AB8B94_14225 [Hyphomicrobiales bacterium]
MNPSVIRFAVQEWVRSFAPNTPKGIGARDYLWLSVFVAVIVLLMQFFGAVVTSIPLRMEQTLLGATEQGQRPVRLNINYLRREGLSASTVMHIQRDPLLAGSVFLPQRTSEINGSKAVSLPFYLSKDPLMAAHRSEEDKPFLLAQAENSPIWDWALEGTKNDPKSDLVFHRLAVGNTTQMDTRYPPESYYSVYRDGVLRLPEYHVFRRFLPEKISSWSELTHLVLMVKERRGEGMGLRLQPFEMVWKPGLLVPENAALIIPLSLLDAINAQTDRLNFLFAAEGVGAKTNRFSAIEIDLDLEDSELLLRMKTAVTQLAKCLGGGNDTPLQILKSEFEWRLDARASDTMVPGVAFWAQEDMAYCVAKTQLPSDVLEVGSAYDSYFNLVSRKVGDDVFLPVVDGKPFFGLLEVSCDAMSSNDIQTASFHGHRAVSRCSTAQDTSNSDRDGAMFLDAYERATFVLAKKSGPNIDLVDELQKWTVAQAQRRLGDAQLFNPQALDEDALEAVKKKQLESLDTSYEANLKTKVFRLDVAYSKALTQFKLLFQALTMVGAVLMLVAISILTFVVVLKQMGIVEHRLGQFSLFLHYGFSGMDLMGLLLIQNMLSAIVGISCGVLLGNTAVTGLNWLFTQRPVYETVLESFGLDLTNLLIVLNSDQTFKLALTSLLIVAAWTCFVAMWYRIPNAVYASDVMVRQAKPKQEKSLTKEQAAL